jgi:hypothetical protein
MNKDGSTRVGWEERVVTALAASPGVGESLSSHCRCRSRSGRPVRRRGWRGFRALCPATHLDLRRRNLGRRLASDASRDAARSRSPSAKRRSRRQPTHVVVGDRPLHIAQAPAAGGQARRCGPPRQGCAAIPPPDPRAGVAGPDQLGGAVDGAVVHHHYRRPLRRGLQPGQRPQQLRTTVPGRDDDHDRRGGIRAWAGGSRRPTSSNEPNLRGAGESSVGGLRSAWRCTGMRRQRPRAGLPVVLRRLVCR